VDGLKGISVAKMPENLVGRTSAIGGLQYTKFFKTLFLYDLKWAISLVLSDQITTVVSGLYTHAYTV